MKGKYSKLILEYCKKNDISVPLGFRRHAASHMAVIRYESGESKLVAKTFFNKEDLVHYILSTLTELSLDKDGNIPAKIVDFKGNIEFKVASNGTLFR